jgi:PAS domain S-box-containing protein
LHRKRFGRINDSDTRFRLLMQSVQDYALVMLDVDGRVIEWSSGAERLMGWTEAEALGQPASFFFTPEDRGKDAPAQEQRRAVRDGRATNERWHIRKDGSRFWGSGLMYPLIDAGTVQGFFKVFRDTTVHVEAARERGALLAKTQIARRDAEAANAVKDEFLAVLSHELRTPLNAILGWTRILRTETEADPERLRHALAVIERNGRRQQQMIEELLDISRIVSGRIRLHPSNVELTDVVEHTLQSFRPDVEEKRLTIDLRVPAAPCRVHADADRLQQIVWNLLSNAVKFTPAGGAVAVHVTCTDTAARLVVRDTGEGIDASLLPHVFDRFRQGDSSPARRHGGLGLGLAIVRQLVDAHGGTVTAESAGNGHGTTFAVTFPLAGVERRTRRRHGPRQDTEADGSGLRVLVVDDDSDARELMGVVLHGSGAIVLTADSADEAIDVLQREPVDVLVSDIGLPGEDGYTLMRRVRAMWPDRRLPAVAVTAYVGLPDRRAAIEAGFDRHIGKPIEPEQVVRVVASLAHASQRQSTALRK